MGAAAGPSGQGKQTLGQHGATSQTAKLYGLDSSHPEAYVGPSATDAQRQQSQKARVDHAQISSSSHQAPSNNQSGVMPTVGGGTTGPAQAEGLAPFLNIDLKLTNEPTQFNCFMNSIVQAIWHCKPANEALKEVQDLGDETLS